jgi:hypothetical protein
MVRRAAFIVSIVLVLLAIARPAGAGGSPLEVSGGPSVRIGGWDLPYAGVGATVTMRSAFSDGQQAPVTDGPWYVYLESEVGVPGEQSDPIQLAPVHIAPTGGYPYVATTTFEVPDVPTGLYWVNVCDRGCTQGVGDVVGGTIVVGATGSEARLFARSQVLTWMRDGDARTIRRLRTEAAGLRSEVSGTRRELDGATAASVRANERAADAEADAARRGALLEEAERRASRWRLISSLLVVALVLAVGIGVWMSRRARRLLVPDTPARLVEAPRGDRTPV